MAGLSVYLPPFAGDYSGACSALFGLDCLTVIVDASCCTRNYTEYDEPRWQSCRKSTFCAQLRTMDAVMGDDAHLLEQVADAAVRLKPACIALVGTPVPAVVGMDVDGMAAEAESACGVPAFGVPTTGFDTYEQGASLAYRLLAGRFAAEGPEGAGSEAAQPAPRPCANVLGITPQDYGTEAAMHEAEDTVRAAGFDLTWGTAGGYALVDIARAAGADVTFVASWSGLAAARLLRERCGVPYRVGLPGGLAACVPGASALSAAMGTSSADELLIMHDQVIAGMLRADLRGTGETRPIRVASFFQMDAELAEPGDFAVETEAQLIRFAEQHPRTAIAGDPLLRRMPAVGRAIVADLPHEAVSSLLFL